MAETQQHAGRARDHFGAACEARYEEAVECVGEDWQGLLAFHDSAAEHWPHLRATNLIERVFATVRLRTLKLRGSLGWKMAFAMDLCDEDH